MIKSLLIYTSCTCNSPVRNPGTLTFYGRYTQVGDNELIGDAPGRNRIQDGELQIFQYEPSRRYALRVCNGDYWLRKASPSGLWKRERDVLNVSCVEKMAFAGYNDIAASTFDLIPRAATKVN